MNSVKKFYRERLEAALREVKKFGFLMLVNLCFEIFCFLLKYGCFIFCFQHFVHLQNSKCLVKSDNFKLGL